ncbi:MAG TPA: SatD family protein [Puia sp.]|nr:SatD family protein [Puia sp.]
MIKSFVMRYIPRATKKSLKDAHPKRPLLTRGYFNIGYDIRLAVGIGEVDFIGKGKSATSDGPAFQLSGHALDSLKDQNILLALKTGDAELNEELAVIISLLDAVTQKWTQNQAELTLYKLKLKRDEEISRILEISLSAVNQRKRNAQWTAIEKAVQFFETKIEL